MHPFTAALMGELLLVTAIFVISTIFVNAGSIGHFVSTVWN